MKTTQIKIKNYKSIRNLELELKPINILIGGNGVGKSNFISFFKLLNRIAERRLQSYVAKQGGADELLYFGLKTSKEIYGEIDFLGESGYMNSYSFELTPDNDASLFFEEEHVWFNTSPLDSDNSGTDDWRSESLGVGHNETRLNQYANFQKQKKGYAGISGYIINYLDDLKVYHFHDTSSTAGVKQWVDIDDNSFLREDASNLAAFLFWVQEKHPSIFRRIAATIKRIAPFFERFDLKPGRINESKIRLEWLERGSDKYFNAHSLSDGTLRMMCMVTLLLQPNPPSVIVIDEPELGLHPAAINILAGLIKKASQKVQVIVSTQSVTLINHFSPDEIVVVDREDQQSVFKRIDEEDLKLWQEDYSMGEIWEKNLIGGRP